MFLISQVGYEFHVGEIQYQSMFDNYLPLVSLLQGEPYLPENPIQPAEDIEQRDLSGWKW